MPLMDHLRELRNRLVKSILVIILGMIVALVFSNQTLNIVARPFCSAVIDGRADAIWSGTSSSSTGCSTGSSFASRSPSSSR